MNNINNPPTNTNQVNNISAINGEEVNLIDLTLAVTLTGLDFSEQQISSHLKKIDESNNIVEHINKISEKSRISQNGPANYTAPSWNINGNTIQLSNGYNVAFNQGQDGIELAINDNANNQIIYKNGVLVPTKNGKTVDALNVGIPIMSDSSLVLGDGTTITFTTAPSDTPLDPNDLSGGIAQVPKITIQRGNQSIEISNANTANAIIGAAQLNANLGANFNYGHVLLENGGLHSWEYNGQLIKDMTAPPADGQGDQINNLFARKVHFQNNVDNYETIYAAEPYLTADDKKLLTDLKIEYSDTSGIGKLTAQEWSDLDNTIQDKKDSITSTSQFEYLALQRATADMTTKAEFASNVSKNLFDLLKKIISSIT
jgi:hypothetical protein